MGEWYSPLQATGVLQFSIMNEAMFPFSASCPLPNNIDGRDILPILPIDVLSKRDWSHTIAGLKRRWAFEQLALAVHGSRFAHKCRTDGSRIFGF